MRKATHAFRRTVIHTRVKRPHIKSLGIAVLHTTLPDEGNSGGDFARRVQTSSQTRHNLLLHRGSTARYDQPMGPAPHKLHRLGAAIPHFRMQLACAD